MRAVPVVDARTGAITGYVNPDAGNAAIDPATARYIGLPAFNAGQPQSRQRTGTAGRNTERTKGVNNFDFILGKQFALTEGKRLEFRTEFFNLFNHPQYGVRSISPFSPLPAGPAANVATTQAGRFLQPQFGDGGGRVVRYLLKLSF